MSQVFRPGDKIVCIDADGIDADGVNEALIKGNEYKVLSAGEEFVFLMGNRGPYFIDRFALVRDPTKEKAPEQSKRKLTLPTDSNARKDVPMLKGCLDYFPAALAGVANTSKRGNDKHNPGQELHHARSKSADQGDCIVRHLMDTEDLLAAMARGDSTVTAEEILIEVNQLAWRALAYAQEVHEKLGAPLAPGAKL